MKTVIMKGDKPENDTEEVMHSVDPVNGGNCVAVDKNAKIQKVRVTDGVVRVYVFQGDPGGIDIIDMPFNTTDQVIVEMK